MAVMRRHILAADIGGTNSRFGHFSLVQGRLELLQCLWLPTREAESFPALLDQLAGQGFDFLPETADFLAVAVAGPVRQGLYCAPVNIPWELDLERTAKALRLPRERVHLLNDFEAQALACTTSLRDSAREILPGTPAPDGTVGVIGAGTGLGKCALRPLPGGGWITVPSEGGHSDFPFLDAEEQDYARFVQHETGHRQCIGDRIVSGPGLSLLHRFLTGQTLEPAAVTALFAADLGCLTLDRFARFYGRACRNYALEVLATGGLFIAGGVAARCPVIVEHHAFEREFRHSETHPELLARIPVRLISDQNSGLWGAAAAALQRLPAHSHTASERPARHVFLVGPRASGKSTLGRALAERLRLPFTDMDQALEQHLGQSIADYVRTLGWEAFRAEESRLLERLCTAAPAVVATGGGVVLAPENRRLLQAGGTVLYLRADKATLLARLHQDPLPDQRPALSALPLEQEIEKTLRERDPLYLDCAHLVLDATADMATVLRQIMAELKDPNGVTE